MKITNDQSEKFTTSNCSCEVCKDMNNPNWCSGPPKNNAEKRLREVIDRIEKRERERDK